MNGEEDFGSRGEAWVAGQMALFAWIFVAGARGRKWPPGTRTPTRLLGLAAAGAGGYFVAKGVQALGDKITPLPAPPEKAELRTDGVYGLVRHPIYMGVLGLWLAWALFRSPRAVGPTAILYCFLVMKSAKEEEWLEERFPEYAAYRSRVRSRIIPGIG
jgi:protein-S-isoprenylcysteine O-methyltransferase Ste14